VAAKGSMAARYMQGWQGHARATTPMLVHPHLHKERIVLTIICISRNVRVILI
jgi:hypothetical protein